ncbi:MAG TPA: UDP-3-O-(3-hydroxymyristoyl)glucosamine N-acyltransferase, partial [Terriglobales bacterium]|nr:UDP-3-O-(3-hydroxymyristoyl)glucosamine N-acyltransferase [Terriglobales bacterium]
AGAVIAPSDTKALDSDKPLLLSKSPKLSFVRAAKLLADPAEHQLGVHSTAIVHKDAKIALGVSIGPYATIGKNSSIGARTRIGANVHIAANVSIGGQCAIGANVTIYSGTAIHERVMIHAGSVLGSDGFGFVRDPATGGYEKFPQIGKLEILDDVEIGANCTVDRGALESTIIGRGAKLDNLVHVGHNVRIGENVVIAAQTGISGSSVIGDNVLVGGQVGIADHVTVEDGAILGAQCGIPTGKAIRGKGVVFWGTPARPLKQHLKELAALARLVKKGEKSSK